VSLPAEAVELLRQLLDSPATSELELEAWLRSYPQVLGGTPDDVYPKARFRLPGEPSVLWEPDILYRRVDSRFYDVVELKKTDLPIVQHSNIGSTRWVPSKAPQFSSRLARAISQLEIYLLYANEHQEYLERTHSLQLCLPQGLLIAGVETDLTSARDLRFLRHHLPKGVDLLTWTGVLRSAETLVARRVVLSIPAVSGSGAYDDSVHESIVKQFFEWTGFRTRCPTALEILAEGWRHRQQSSKELHATYNIDHDEDRKIIMSFEALLAGDAYYRAGKYCRDDNQLAGLVGSDTADDCVGPRSFTKRSDRLREGYIDRRSFLEEGRGARSVPDLERRIEEVLRTRSGHLVEPEWYYRRLMTSGFLSAHLLNGDLTDLLVAAGWVNDDKRVG
jgi:hypothetical protein